MTFIDLAIIYLACGAPLSMHYFFAASRKPDFYFAAKIVLVALVWPVAAFLLIKSLRKPLAGVILSGNSEIDRKLDSLRLELEQAAFSDETASSVFEFRELFARYTGLARTALVDAGQDTSNELFLLSGHKNTGLASRCLGRKSSNRLTIHANAAREDFVESIAALSIGAERDVVQTASEVAGLVGDVRTDGMLRELAAARLESNFRSTSADRLRSPEPLRSTVG